MSGKEYLQDNEKVQLVHFVVCLEPLADAFDHHIWELQERVKKQNKKKNKKHLFLKGAKKVYVSQQMEIYG